MKWRCALATVVLLAPAPAAAHRLDEYLQAATIQLSRDHVVLELRLAPGSLVAASVLDAIDRDRNGALSDAEVRAYGDVVMRDLSLRADGRRVAMRITSWNVSTLDELLRGVGQLNLRIEARRPTETSGRLSFENRHRRDIGAYLANSLVPEDPGVRIVSQRRNHEQSTYEMVFVATASRPTEGTQPRGEAPASFMSSAGLNTPVVTSFALVSLMSAWFVARRMTRRPGRSARERAPDWRP